MTNKNNNVKLTQMAISDVKNDELKEALEKMKNERTRENEVAMFGKLKDAKLMLPAVMQGKDARHLQIKFILINTKDGKSYFPAFTDQEEAKKLKMDAGVTRQYIIRTLKDFEVMLKDPNNKTVGVALNPGSTNIILPNELVFKLNAIHEGKVPAAQPVAEGPVNITFSEPRIYPTALVNGVYEKCLTLKNVSRVWFKQMNAGLQVSFALFVEADEKVTPELMEEIKDAAVPFAKDIPVVAFEYNQEWEEKAVQNAVPLYDRELNF